MNKIQRTWSLMSACWQILKRDKEMLVFPLISGLCCLLLLASFAIPIYLTGAWEPPKSSADASRQVMYYGTLLLFYVCNYFVVIFFNCAIVACATIRMGGGNPTVSDGFRAATSRLPGVAGWALVSATVGLVLRIIEERSEKVGRFVAGLLGMAWTLASFLLAGNFSFGLLFFLLGIPAYALIVLGIISGSGVTAVFCIGLAVVYLIVLALVQSALQSIFQAAVYLYARQGQVPEGFQEEFLSGAMVPKSDNTTP